MRLGIGNMDCSWPVAIAQGLAHDCILGSDVFQHDGCQIHYDKGTFRVIVPPPPPPHQREMIDQTLDELIAAGRVQQSQRPCLSLETR